MTTPRKAPKAASGKTLKNLKPKAAAIKGGRDSAGGLPTGKRMHTP